MEPVALVLTRASSLTLEPVTSALFNAASTVFVTSKTTSTTAIAERTMGEPDASTIL